MSFSIINERVKCSSYISSSGASEYFLVVESDISVSLADALEVMNSDLAAAMSQLAVGEDDLVFSRFYLSDIANQRDVLSQSSVYEVCSNGACAVIQQSPLGVGRITLLAYCVRAASFTKEKVSALDDGWQNGVSLCGANYTQYWSANHIGGDIFDSYTQTNDIFSNYAKFISGKGMNLLDNAIRTWIYVRDIDNHYAGMVESRKEFFEEHGLTTDTHYIASTGIEARLKETTTLVSMDALSIDGIVAEQIEQMEALENLNPTHEYGVTFERGTKVVYGDREHYYISGTASIDKYGDVVHIGDVEKQAHRTLDNIEALLAPHGATLNDMSHLIVYLRNFTERECVEKILRERVGIHIPLVVVRGAVCRPTWLIEIEGVGVRMTKSAFPDFG